MNSDEILANELKKLGRISGAIGGLMGGSPAGVIAAAWGAGGGAYFAAKYLPTEQYKETIQINKEPIGVAQLIFKVISKVGKIKNDNEFKSENPTFFALVGSGAFGLNPCLVSFEMTEVTDSYVKVEVIGAAKEGLIKQNTSKKAVAKVMTALRSEI